MTYYTETHGSAATFFGRLSTFFADVAKSFADARQYRRTYNELQSLSQRELNDLGIDRSEIARIAREGVYGK